MFQTIQIYIFICLMLYFNPKDIMGFWGFPAETLLTAVICWKLMVPAGHPNLCCIDHEYEYEYDEDDDDDDDDDADDDDAADDDDDHHDHDDDDAADDDHDHDHDDHVRHHEGSSIIECSPYAQG